MQLFDGRTLDGWAATGNPDGWTVDQGCIYCTADKGQYLYYTNDLFRDFELSLEFRHPPGANSGVFFRWTDLDDPVQTGIEIQILDTHGREPATTKCCGAVYDVKAPKHNACKPAGEWNQMEIYAVDNDIRVALNGEQVTEMDLSGWTTPGRNPDGTPNKFNRAYCEMTEAGYIGLQDHNSRIWFRNIVIEKR